jgi:hypothetical protein
MRIETILADRPSYYTPTQAEAYYGRKRTMEEIVLHHWDIPSKRGSFRGTLDYLLHRPNGVPSVNCVIGWDEQEKRVRIVDTVVYPNVAFTSSSSSKAALKNDRAKYINCVSAAIEVDPLIETDHPARDQLIEAVAYRVSEWRRQAGKNLPLKGHNDYVKTDCPGDMPFNEIEDAAQGGGENMLTRRYINMLWIFATDNPANDTDYRSWEGKKFEDLVEYLNQDGNRKNWLKVKTERDALESENKKLKDDAKAVVLAEVEAALDKVRKG